MTRKLKLYHKLLPFLFIPVCLVIAFSYGWIAFATVTATPGLNGSFYYYYRLTRLEFYIYIFIVSIVALGFIIVQVCYLVTANALSLTKTFKKFGLFIALLLIEEFLLQLRFVSKG
jgi:hypothetical protein